MEAKRELGKEGKRMQGIEKGGRGGRRRRKKGQKRGRKGRTKKKGVERKKGRGKEERERYRKDGRSREIMWEIIMMYSGTSYRKLIEQVMCLSQFIEQAQA